MSITTKGCRFCSRTTAAIVKTPNGFSHVCADHVDRMTNAVSVTWLDEVASPPPSKTGWKTANEMTGTEFAARVAAVKAGA